PRDFVHRRKMGFGIPVHDWISGPLMPLIQDTLHSPNDPVFDVVRRDVARDVVDRFMAGDTYGSGQIWVLMILMIWFERTLAGPMPTHNLESRS
ncbi:MAG: hypothetical protein HQL86_09605, partial [Magnetococcales bacterium]|nr:hypothetical protein [Magnetococcales bacterium]